ncbi:MAG: hypothetical protein JXR51_08200 [Bacteroidales bacterium]|nr:hypothetical protein [Bacteroidales bacterium]
MKISKYISIVLLSTTVLFSNTTITESKNSKEFNLIVKEQSLSDFIEFSSKVLNKNIVISDQIDKNSKIDFISTNHINQGNLKEIMEKLLYAKGLIMLEHSDYIEIKNIDNFSSSKVINEIENKDDYLHKVVTEIIKIKNGNSETILNQVRHLVNKNGKIVADKNSNTIVITDVYENIIEIKKIIDNINDKNGIIISSVKLKHQRVGNILPILISSNNKFSKEFNSNIDITKDEMTNSIIFTGNYKDIDKMRELLDTLDVESKNSKTITKVIYLKNSEAKEIEPILTRLLAQRKFDINIDRPVITADQELNTILISSQSNIIEELEDTINQLDKPRQQVYIKASIVELEESSINKVGMKYGFDFSSLTGNGLTTLGTNIGGPAVANNLLTTLTSNEGSKSNFRLGLSLELLKSKGAVNILSEPSILSINNKESTISAGSTISVLNSSMTPATGGITNTYTREDIGILLKVKPRLSNDNKVQLDVLATLEGLVEDGKDTGTPTTTKREVVVNAILNDGEPVIIGGLIRTDVTDVESSVPFFGDIPLVGEAFKSKNKEIRKTNLVIILTPYIIDNKSDLSSLQTKLSDLKDAQDKFNRVMLNIIEHDADNKELSEDEREAKDARKGKTNLDLL